MTFDITIQIINYNTKKYLEKCLEGIISDLENSNINYRINVLDNNSKDDLSDLEKKLMENNKTFFYFSKQNLGFGKGHNYLAKKNDARYILILNPDVDFIEENTIKRLFERISADSKIKVIGPKLLADKGAVQLWDHGELIGFLAWVALNSGDSYGKNRNEICEVAWVSGAFFLIESEIFNRLGGFDENFFLYKEEEDLCLRIRKSGGKILYNPNVAALHYGSVVARKNVYLQKSVDYFVEKHFRSAAAKVSYNFFRFLYEVIKKLGTATKKHHA